LQSFAKKVAHAGLKGYKHNKQSPWIGETLINTGTCSPKTELKGAKNFKRISSIPIQIRLNKNDNIQIHQYIGMSQD